MNAFANLAERAGIDLRAYEPTVDEMVDLPSTGICSSELDYWRGIRERSNDGAPAELAARADAHVAFWEARLRLAERRDALLEERRSEHPDCFCLGRGGRNPVTLTYQGADGDVLAAFEDGMPVTAFEDWCPCPDGQRALGMAEELRAEMAAASRRRKLDRIVGLAQIPPIYAGMTADTWRAAMMKRKATVNQVTPILVAIGAWFKQNWDRSAKPPEAPSLLLLAGPYGTGKSALAAALGQKWLDDGRTVLFRPSPEWFAQLRASPWRETPDGRPTELALIETARACDLFILDDWGSESVTDASEQRLVEQTAMLLDHRLSHGLPTILTTNLTRKEIAGRVGGRILDRVTGNLSVRVNLNDLPSLRGESW